MSSCERWPGIPDSRFSIRMRRSSAFAAQIQRGLVEADRRRRVRRAQQVLLELGPLRGQGVLLRVADRVEETGHAVRLGREDRRRPHGREVRPEVVLAHPRGVGDRVRLLAAQVVRDDAGDIADQHVGLVEAAEDAGAGGGDDAVLPPGEGVPVRLLPGGDGRGDGGGAALLRGALKPHPLQLVRALAERGGGQRVERLGAAGQLGGGLRAGPRPAAPGVGLRDHRLDAGVGGARARVHGTGHRVRLVQQLHVLVGEQLADDVLARQDHRGVARVAVPALPGRGVQHGRHPVGRASARVSAGSGPAGGGRPR